MCVCVWASIDACVCVCMCACMCAAVLTSARREINVLPQNCTHGQRSQLHIPKALSTLNYTNNTMHTQYRHTHTCTAGTQMQTSAELLTEKLQQLSGCQWLALPRFVHHSPASTTLPLCVCVCMCVRVGASECVCVRACGFCGIAFAHTFNVN